MCVLMLVAVSYLFLCVVVAYLLLLAVVAVCDCLLLFGVFAGDC